MNEEIFIQSMRIDDTLVAVSVGIHITTTKPIATSWLAYDAWQTFTFRGDEDKDTRLEYRKTFISLSLFTEQPNSFIYQCRWM